MATGDFHRPEHLTGWKTLVPSPRSESAVVEYLRSRGSERIFIVAASMGGLAAFRAADEAELDLAGIVSLATPQFPSIYYSGEPAENDVTPERLQRIAAPKLFLAGAGGMASNLTTFALYTPALALIAGSGLALRQQGLAALTILVITLMVAWVPLVLAAVVPGASTRLLPWLGGWMNANNRWIQVVLGLGFGIWLLVKGVNGL